MSHLKKVRKLPLRIRKMILFGIVFIIGIVLIWFWSGNFVQNFKDIKTGNLMEEFKIPSLKEKIQRDLPRLELPAFSDIEESQLEQ